MKGKLRETRTDKGFIRIDAKYRLGLISKDAKHWGKEVTTDYPFLEPAIIKTGNDQPISDDEPRIIFRGRDRLALPMLRFYRSLCQADGCTDYQLKAVDDLIAEFADFAETSPTLKQPGITLGK